jgi:Tfp pilus assembly protein PilE
MITVGTDAYITETEYRAYADIRGIDVKLEEIEADLVRSADFINNYYQLKDGYALPTTDAAKIAEIAKAALKACEMQQKGLLSVNLAELSSGVVKRLKTKVDVLEKEIEYQDGTQPTSKPRTPELDRLLRPFVVGGVGLVRV